MKERTVICAVGVLLAAATCASPALGQYIYLGDYANDCMMQPLHPAPYPPSIKHIYVDCPGVTDAVAVSFRLGSELIGPEDVVSATPAPGVAIESGDLFSGITLSLPGSALRDLEVLSLELVDTPPHQQSWDYEVIHSPKIIRASGDTLCLDEAWAFFCCSDCFELHVIFGCPDTVDVHIGADSLVRFRTVVTAAGMWGCSIEVTDDRGWVTGYTPSSIWGDECGFCAWDSGFNTIAVSVPGGAEAYELSTVTIRPLSAAAAADSAKFCVRAIPPVGVRDSSWGVLKKLFKNR
jgi:hypothetical protein